MKIHTHHLESVPEEKFNWDTIWDMMFLGKPITFISPMSDQGGQQFITDQFNRTVMGVRISPR